MGGRGRVWRGKVLRSTSKAAGDGHFRERTAEGECSSKCARKHEKDRATKWVPGMLAVGMDCVWKWARARDGFQHVVEYGDGFEGWYWRSSVYSASSIAPV